MSKLPEAQPSKEAPVTIDDPDVPETRKAFVPLGACLPKLLLPPINRPSREQP